ncbi:MAG: NAD(P)-dependent oxidoreductase [Planctomycetota bacterium]|nr:NAD(P)-dependent oxidoreductase [Planctomycetota bacterium]
MNDLAQPTGLIGLGLLGSAIGQRIRSSGIPVTGFDVCSEATDSWAKGGGSTAESPADIFVNCDHVILCLPDSSVCRKVLETCEGQIRNQHLVIDTSTGNPEEVIANEEWIRQRGGDLIECTIAGSSQQVKQDQATLILGGRPGALERGKELISTLGTRQLKAGQPGNASKMKLVHNLVLGLHRLVLAEGLSFAGALGLSTRDTLDLLRETPAYSGVMKTKGDKMINGEFQPQARLSQHKKDVELMIEAALAAETDLPVSRLHLEILTKCEQQGWGALDNCAIIRAFD